MKRQVLTICVILGLMVVFAQGQTAGSGLEVSNPRELIVLYEPLSEATQGVISSARVETLVDLKLREYNINPRNSRSVPAGSGFLVVQVQVVSTAFSINLSFYRFVNYSVFNNDYESRAKTWDSGLFGQLSEDETADRETVISEYLTQQLEEFIDSFQQANTSVDSVSR